MKSFKKLIILDHEPFSDRKKNHYFIDSFREKGIEVEYWCLSNILSYSKHIIYSYGSVADYVTYFECYHFFLKQLKAIDVNSTAIIIEFWYELSTIEIYRCIKEMSIFWIKIEYYHNPTEFLNPVRSLFSRLFSRRKRLFSKIIEYIRLRKVKYEMLNVAPLLFLTGSNREHCPPALKTISLDYFDIEEYKGKVGKPELLEFRYIVFLDIMLVDHPDFQRLGNNAVIPRELYFSHLNRFFDQVEKKTGLPVVIASHPKADYNSEFGHRLCIKNKTAELSIGAELVLTHGSLSISYALLVEKPLLYIYFEKLFDTNEQLKILMYRMRKACDMLQVPMINVESDDIDFQIPVPQRDQYKKFLDLLYRKITSSDDQNFDIIFKELELHFNDRKGFLV